MTKVDLDEVSKPKSENHWRATGSILLHLSNFLGLTIGLWVFFMDLIFLYSMWGGLVTIFAWGAFPLTILVTPILFIIFEGNWFPLILTYGSLTIIWIIKFIGWNLTGCQSQAEP